MKIYSLILSIAFSLFAVSSAIPGTATYYTAPYTPSSCYGEEEIGTTMFAAASIEIWDNREACGRSYNVRCTGATNEGVKSPCTTANDITVKIVDYCPPPGCQGTIDLSQESFAAIADPEAGKITIEYSLSE